VLPGALHRAAASATRGRGWYRAVVSNGSYLPLAERSTRCQCLPAPTSRPRLTPPRCCSSVVTGVSPGEKHFAAPAIAFAVEKAGDPCPPP
jgi:hypothetical protein